MGRDVSVQIRFGSAGRVVLAAVLLTAPVAAEDWPQFRGPTGQGHSSRARVAARVERNQERRLEDAGAGDRLVVAGRGRRAGVADDPDRQRAPRPRRRRCARSRSTPSPGPVWTSRCSGRLAGPQHPKNSHASPTPIVDGDRVYVHFGADGTAALTRRARSSGRRGCAYESQHGNGGSPVLYRDLLIVNCDGNGGEAYVVALDTRPGRSAGRRPAPAGRSGLFDAARHPRRRSRSARLVRRLPRGGVRSADRRGDLARELRRRLLERAAAGVRPRPRVHRDRIQQADADRGSAGRPRRRHADARRVDVDRGAPYTPSPLLVGDELYFVSDTGVLTSWKRGPGSSSGSSGSGATTRRHPSSPTAASTSSSEEGVTTVIAPGRASRGSRPTASMARRSRRWRYRAARSSSAPTATSTGSPPGSSAQVPATLPARR